MCSRAGVKCFLLQVWSGSSCSLAGGSDLCWQQLMGGVCDDSQPVKHVRQTLQPSQPSLRAAAGSRPAAFPQLLPVFTSAASRCCCCWQVGRQAGGRRTRTVRRGWMQLRAGWRGAATRRSYTTTRCMCGEVTRWVINSLPVQVTRGKHSLQGWFLYRELRVSPASRN